MVKKRDQPAIQPISTYKATYSIPPTIVPANYGCYWLEPIDWQSKFSTSGELRHKLRYILGTILSDRLEAVHFAVDASVGHVQHTYFKELLDAYEDQRSQLQRLRDEATEWAEVIRTREGWSLVFVETCHEGDGHIIRATTTRDNINQGTKGAKVPPPK